MNKHDNRMGAHATHGHAAAEHKNAHIYRGSSWSALANRHTLVRRIASVAVAAAMTLALFATGCSGVGATSGSTTPAASDGSSGGAGASNDGLTKLTFVLDYVPNTNHTGIYAAIDQGYYAEEGLEVEVVQPPDDGADALVGSGKAQLGMSYQDVMANYLGSENPLPVTAVAAVVQHNTSGIASRAGEGMDHAAGLAGHRYGTWDQDVEKAIMKSIVESDGGSWDDVELVPANSSDDIAGLRTNMYDAIWVYEGWALQNAKVQDYPVDYFSIRSVDETFDYYTPVIVANDGFLAEEPDVAAAFLAATQKGYEFAASNPDDAAEILVTYAPETDPELARVSQQYMADLYKDDAAQWGYIDPVRWNRFYRWMGTEGLVPVEIPDNTGFTNEFLPKG